MGKYVSIHLIYPKVTITLALVIPIKLWIVIIHLILNVIICLQTKQMCPQDKLFLIQASFEQTNYRSEVHMKAIESTI